MSIIINELSITVPGNIVKNNDKDGNTVLRVSQDQAESLHSQLGPVLDFFASQSLQADLSAVGNSASPLLTPEVTEPKGAKKSTEAGIQHDGDPA